MELNIIFIFNYIVSDSLNLKLKLELLRISSGVEFIVRQTVRTRMGIW